MQIEYYIGLPYQFLYFVNDIAKYQRGSLVGYILVFFLEAFVFLKGPGSAIYSTPFSKNIAPF